MWDRFFRQRAYIGITQSRMRWYVRKFYLSRIPVPACWKDKKPKATHWLHAGCTSIGEVIVMLK